MGKLPEGAEAFKAKYADAIRKYENPTKDDYRDAYKQAIKETFGATCGLEIYIAEDKKEKDFKKVN